MRFIKYWLAAGGAAITLLGGSAAAAGHAHAATPSCGDSCIGLFSGQFGDPLTGHPAFLQDSFKQGVKTGTPIILFRESNMDPAEDFILENQGTVADFYAAGLVSATTALHYGCVRLGHDRGNFSDCLYGFLNPRGDGSANLPAFEAEYDPFGAPTGQCVGVAAAPFSGEHVTLQPCGVSAKTVWIIDVFDGSRSDNPFGPGAPAINGANTNFSHPFVLTYPESGYPTDQPRPVLEVTNLSGHPGDPAIFPTFTEADTDVNSNQIWSADLGPIRH